MGLGQVIEIRSRGHIVVELARTALSLRKVVNLQVIFAETMIHLRRGGKFDVDAFFMPAALDVVELPASSRRVVQPDIGLGEDGPLVEVRRLIADQQTIVDAFAELTGSIKVHRFDVQPRKRQPAQCAAGAVRVPDGQFEAGRDFTSQFAPFAQMNKRDRLKNVEQNKSVDVACQARQPLAFRAGAAALLVPRPPAIDDTGYSIAPDQDAIIRGIRAQLDRPVAERGVLFAPAVEEQVDARAAALDQSLECVVRQRLAVATARLQRPRGRRGDPRASRGCSPP